jgi:sugar phosphate isomerase/epimerase
MHGQTDRRRFLKAAGVTALAGAELAFPHAASLARPGSDATGESGARLLPGCCAYSFKKHLDSHEMTMEDFIRKAVELDVTGVDMTGYWLKPSDAGSLTSLRHLAFKNGVPFSGVACGSSMVQADPAERAQVLEDIKQWVGVTEWLGASHLRIFAGRLPKGVSLGQATDWTIETMKRACDYSAKKGITLGVEDHDGVTQTAEVCVEIMRRVDSPYAGINLDISHFIPSPEHDPYAQIEACVPYASHTHIHPTFDNGDPIDFDRVWKIFAKAGYKGYMSAEYEGKEDPTTAVPRLMETIRALCRKYSSV